MRYEILITQKTIVPTGEPIYSEQATIVSIEDESGGEYVKIKQYSEDLEKGEIAINPGEEWETLKSVIEDMIGKCRDEFR